MKLKILAVLILSMLPMFGANVSFTCTTATGAANTNPLKITQVNPVANADGTYTTIGVPIRLVPNTNGYAITNLAQGNYSVTNLSGGPIWVIRVPLDLGSTIYNGTCTYYNYTKELYPLPRMPPPKELEPMFTKQLVAFPRLA